MTGQPGPPPYPAINSHGALMLKFFYNAAPNPMKVALLLEELALP
jgi:hypothetical protein